MTGFHPCEIRPISDIQKRCFMKTNLMFHERKMSRKAQWPILRENPDNLGSSTGDTMRSVMTAGFVAGAVLMAGTARAEPEKAKIELAPYRAVYDLMLADPTKSSTAIEGAKGRMVMESNGNRCEGYTNRVRIIVLLTSGERGDHRIETVSNSFESGDGKSMRFKIDTRQDNTKEQIDGQADLNAKGIAIKLKEPRRKSLDLDGTAIFPTEHTLRILEAAVAKERFLSVKVYDGTGKGERVNDTLSIIGERIAPGGEDKLEAPVRIDQMKKIARWPVKISFFEPGTKDGTPFYSLNGEMFENGIVQNMRLDYSDFSLKAELKQLELIQPSGDCR